MSENHLSPSLVEKIHAASMANIARKVQDKQQLTTTEWKQLNDAKRQVGASTMKRANTMIAEGLAVMEEIRSIIESSRLTAREKTEIFERIASVTTKCTME